VGSPPLKYRKAYSTALNCDVLVNGSVIGTISGGDGTTQTWSSSSINISGDVVLLFTNKSSTSGQITLDDIQWTGYGSGAPAYYTDWAAGYDLDPEGPNGGMDDDYDNDGVPNIDELVGGSHPTNGTSMFEIVDEDKQAGANQFTLTISAVTGRVYSVYYKNTMTNADWTLERAVTNIAAGTQNLYVTNSLDARFYRVSARMP
ncbi:MAG: hypothetical protein KA248_15855, partial [Kiritimatiellae bacterium]|nr:hypothetical protein [Kiritimatiellia bacterium]